jgi:hypothetical protein
MGTSNFSRLNNASKYYTIFMNVEEKYVECNEYNEKFYEYELEYETAESERYCGKCGSDAIEFKEEDRSVESWEVDDWKSYFKECLENVGGEHDEVDRNSDRVYIGFFKFSKWYADVLVELKFHLYYDVGYYEGAKLDYEILVYNGFEYSDDLENALECIFEDSDDLSVGMQKIQSKNAMKWIEKTKEKVSEKIENLFSEVCDNRLELVGTFSNGESIYKEVK